MAVSYEQKQEEKKTPAEQRQSTEPGGRRQIRGAEGGGCRLRFET